MASLKLNSVTKLFPSGTLALYEAGFETKDKEFLVILGGEASGKSTLLRVIAGLETASSGEIIIDGKDVTDADPKDRDLAMVFRSSTLYPSLSVFDNMAFGLKLRKAPETLIEQRVKSAANILGLTDVLYRRPKTLTAAQKQRAAIGRAIVREPKLYLFDEPLSGLDDKLRNELLNVIINLQARMEGTFVYATKNLAEAMTIGTRIAVIKNGIIQQIDTPSNLYDYPANAYVAFIIGSPSVNFLNNAKVVKNEEGIFVEEGNIKLKLPENILKRFTRADEYINAQKTVIAAIRPEDATTGGNMIDAVVGKTEGGYAECETGGYTLTVKCKDGTQSGSKTKIDVDLTRLYLFDGETRLTVLERDGGYEKTQYEDADRLPLTFKEEEEVKDKYKIKKNQKKKK